MSTAGHFGREPHDDESPAFLRSVEEAMWSGDRDRLSEIAACQCCCLDHTFGGCPARLWFGCRGQGSASRAEILSWEEHYARFHGMDSAVFYNDL